MDLTEKTIASQELYAGRIIRVRRDTVRLPDGRETVREVVAHPGAVAIVPVDAGEVLFVRQYRYPAGEVLLEVPAGKLEPGEDPLDCARRELTEEIGRRAERLAFLGMFYTTPGFCDEKMHVFLASGLQAADEADGGRDADEFLDVVKIPLTEALAMLAAGELRDGKTIAALAMAGRRLADEQK